jgi:cell division protein FtsB
MLEKIPTPLKNKYVLSIIAFVVWLTFFDKNDFYSQYRYRQQLKVLQADKKYYTEEIEATTNNLNELMSSPANLEKFARENYLMKRDNEDLFVLVDEKKDKEK